LLATFRLQLAQVGRNEGWGGREGGSEDVVWDKMCCQ
jgi:hypothetical protein